MYWHEGTSVLRLLLEVSVVDPDTYVFGPPSSGSRISLSEVRIRIIKQK